MNWKQIGVVCGALVALVTLGAMAMPLLRSDAPPWANLDRVDDVKAIIVRGNIMGRWSAKCEAVRVGNVGLVLALDAQISDLQDGYVVLTGRPYRLERCP